MSPRTDALRRKIAKNGKLKYHDKFNSILVADYIVSKTFNVKKKFSWN